jgi:TonB family protein
VSYYVRLLGADGFEGPPREGHWVLGDDLRVTPLREAELWGDEGQRRILCKVFGSRTVIAASGAWVEGNQQASLVSSLGGTVYEASIRGTPEAEVLHRIEVRLARRPSLADSAAPIAAEVSLLVESGRVVVIAIPETLLFGRDPAARHGSLVLLALSPRSDPHEIPTIHVAEDVEDLPIPVDTPEPGYPEQARELHPGGDVVLRFVIRDDGGVDGVQLLELPAARGSEWLAAAAVRAVQEWRYLPARRHGRAVPSYLEATLGFTER